MKKSIQSIILDGGTSNSQKREVFKNSTFYSAAYENSQLTLQFLLSDSIETESRFFAVYDTRQAVPDKYLPSIGSVSEEGVTLMIFDVTHDRVSNNERERDLVSFGRYLLSEERTKNIKEHRFLDEEITAERISEVYREDIENWKHKQMNVSTID